MTGVLWREELHERDRKEKLETYLFAMKEDLSEWLAGLMNISVTAETFMDVLDNGVHLCRLANMIQRAAERYLKNNPHESQKLPTFVATYKERGASYGSFVSRDNVANFIRWCRELGIPDVIIFESEDLVLHKYQKPVILTLLDVARRAAKFDVEPPDLVKMEEEIDEEIALEQQALSPAQDDFQHDCHSVTLKSKPAKPKPKTKNFIPKNLDTLVKETVQQCTCDENPFPMEKISDGKYKVGESRVLIFVRVMRNHVMVRVGGGWDTLENYIQKHDPCRGGGRSNGSGSGRRRPRCCHTNHATGDSNDQVSTLHSASNTSVASSDSTSSSSSLSRLSPGSSQSKSLQSMVCVFGEPGSRAVIVPSGDGLSSPSASPVKRFETPVKPDKTKNSTSSKTSGETTSKGLRVRHKSLTDLHTGHQGKERGRSSTAAKQSTTTGPAKLLNSSEKTSTSALKASLQAADLTFGRSRTSDAILRRTRGLTRTSDSPNSAVKRRGSGNLSREASSENLRRGKANTTGMRRKSLDGRRRSPEVKRRSAVSPVPARRRLDLEYEKSSEAQKLSALRKELNDNNLQFPRSFSADAIKRGNERKKEIKSFPVGSPLTTPSKIPVPLNSYGKPRSQRVTSVRSTSPKGSSADNTVSNHDEDGLRNRCGHCGGKCCTCDEGFIDGEISRSSLRPTTLFVNSETQRKFEETALRSRIMHNGSTSIRNGNCDHTNSKTAPIEDSKEHKVNNVNSDIYVNDKGDNSWKDFTGCSRNQKSDGDPSLEWKEVMTDILKYEENRISEKNV